MSAGAGDPPVTYQGEYDPAVTYLPRQLVTVADTPYLSLAKQTGVAPPGATWLSFGGGSGFRAGAGGLSVIGGDLALDATADGSEAMAIGARAVADAQDSLAIGQDAWTHTGAMLSLAIGYSANTRGVHTTALGSGANTNAADGTAVGHNANTGNAIDATALGSESQAESTESTAVGKNASVTTFSNRSTAVGASSFAKGADNTVVGAEAAARTGAGGSVARSVALGTGAVVTANDRGVVKVDSWEIVPSSGGSETSLILHDTAAVRWRVTVDTTGHLTTALA